jgi:hypothetical protein
VLFSQKLWGIMELTKAGKCENRDFHNNSGKNQLEVISRKRFRNTVAD